MMRIMKILFFLLIFTVIASCEKSEQTNAESAIDEGETKRVLDHHWQAFKTNDLEETMKDYTDESVLITPNGTYDGLEEIRANFVNAFKRFPRDSSTFNLDRSLVVKDVGYILWNSKTPVLTLTYGTDTFIIRDGKIVRQTFAGVFQ
jgi:hypothetical protein